MLSMMLEISLGGICSRMKPSIRSQRFAVSSIRVPARARRCSLNCPASTLGKKSRPSQGTSSTNEPTQTTTKPHRNAAAVMQAAVQHLVIAVAESFESQLKRHLHPHQRIAAGRIQVSGFLFVAAEQILGHGRDQRPGQQVGGEHGEHHRFRQRDEQVAGHAGEKEHGQKHDADGQRGNKGRHRDLLRAIQNRLLNFLAFAQYSG